MPFIDYIYLMQILCIIILGVQCNKTATFLVEIILQVSVSQTGTGVVVSQQSLPSLGEEEEDYEASSQ